ncbi:MAG TPA: YcaO-like family protein [Gaiellaceae bacterium]|nr:YcaO-like family protein [Gaiellaceae bacterium]
MLELKPVAATPIESALPRLETFVSPYTGLVRGTSSLLSPPDDMRLHRVVGVLARSEPVVGIELGNKPGGTSAEANRALAAALGESVERYAGSFVPATSVLASAEELGDRAVSPADFGLYDARQYSRPGFPFRPFTVRSRVRWVVGFELGSRAQRYLPAQLVYLPLGTVDGEQPIGHTTSNGLACAATLEEAILAGLFELLERDAFLIAWYASLTLPLLDHTTSRVLRRFAERFFDPSGLRYAAVDLSIFWGVPTVLGVVRSEIGAPLGVGADSASCVEIAWQAALAEAFSVRAWSRSQQSDDPERTFRHDFADIVDFDDHIRYYSVPEHAAETAFLDSSSQRVAAADIPPLPGENVLEQVEAIAARLEERGLHAYVVDVTTPDVRSAGLHVVKVVAPQLVALDSAYAGRCLGARRIYRAAYELGLVGQPLTLDSINPLPHPFP